MSMIFKFTGNYVHDGSWTTPDPAFEGEILVNDDNSICGYCLDNSEIDINSVVYREKYLVGALGTTGKQKQGIAFYKFSDHPYYTPKMYLLTDIKNPDSALWAEQNAQGNFILQGMAKINLQKKIYYKEAEDAIKTRFEQLSTLGHQQIQQRVEACVHCVTSASN